MIKELQSLGLDVKMLTAEFEEIEMQNDDDEQPSGPMDLVDKDQPVT